MPNAPLVISPETRLRDLALHVDGAWRVLGEHHIDYAAGAARTLGEACARAGLDVAALVARLESERERAHGTSRETRWTDHAPWELVEHLLSTHHPFTWSELERLGALLATVRRESGDTHPELAEVAASFGALHADLERHMPKEERVLFPWVLSLRVHEAEGTTPPPPPFGHPRNPSRMMRFEHEAMDAILERLRATTHHYAAPEGASDALRELYAGLAAFDRDLVRHVSLENDVLFAMLEQLP